MNGDDVLLSSDDSDSDGDLDRIEQELNGTIPLISPVQERPKYNPKRWITEDPEDVSSLPLAFLEKTAKEEPRKVTKSQPNSFPVAKF